MSKKIVLAATTVTLLLTACGAATEAPAPSGNTNQTTTTAASQNNSTTSVNPAASTTSTLSPFSQSNISVSVPNGWTKADIDTGGNYVGWTFTNPSDKSQVVKVVRSSCVGCYEDQDGTKHPDKVVPHTDATITQKTSDGLSVVYTFQETGNTNKGQGKLTVSTDHSGYGYVEVQLPATLQTTADQILQSLSLQ